MKRHYTLIALATALLMGCVTSSVAGPEEEAERAAVEAERVAAEAERQAELRGAYEAAIAQAEADRVQAEAALSQARVKMAQAAEAKAESEEERALMREAREVEMEQMFEELARAREQLNETSREVAHINREIARERARATSGSHWVAQAMQKPVIGVVLGEATDEGFEVIGVSPDGPAERAGIDKGDVIVSMAGHDLSADDKNESGEKLLAAKRAMKAGEATTVTYRRKDKLVDAEIVPEVREPLAWHTITRFPSIGSPSEMVSVERIVVPEIDTEELAKRIEQIKIEVADRALLSVPVPPTPPEVLELELHELSELGDSALFQANAWFGLPVAKGLKLAEVNPGLGQYFKTDRGVLVLEARDDNELQLMSGDVVLKVGDSDVNSPAEFMRALREAEPGGELAIDIKRERRNSTLKTTMPERKGFGYLMHGGDLEHELHFKFMTE